MTAIHPHLKAQAEDLAAFCRPWQVAELALFGSVVRDDFGPSSDVDVMVTFTPGAEPSLWDFVTMREELEALFQRPVDLVDRTVLRNPFRRRTIERDLRVVYAA